MRLLLAVILAMLLGCGSDPFNAGPEGPMGPPGPEGAQGAQGEPGPQGPMGLAGKDGEDVAAAGSRLLPWKIVGEDGSRMMRGDWRDTVRAETCAFRELEGESPAHTWCLPPEAEREEWHYYTEPDCTGDRVWTRIYSSPGQKPTSIVRVLSLDPAFDGSALMRGAEVATFYQLGPSGEGPCVEFVPVGDGSGFPPPWHRWVPFDKSAFVMGVEAL